MQSLSLALRTHVVFYLLALCSLSAGSGSRQQLRPVYPLAALGGEHASDKAVPLPSAEDVKTIAENFDFLHGEYSRDWLKLMHDTRPDLGVVKYINSHIVKAADLETTHGGRTSTIFYRTGWLAEALTSDEADSQLSVMLDTRYSPLVASTTKGNVSTKDGFVTHLRLGNELMRVNSVEPPHESTMNLFGVKKNATFQKVLVSRGFDGTAVEAHTQNCNVFSPSYKNYPGQKWSDHVPWADNGDGLWTDTFVREPMSTGAVEAPDDAADSPITYDIDPSSEYASRMLVNFTLTSIAAGYNGSWFDCFSDHVLKATDVGGKPLAGSPYWNFVTNSEYTSEEFSNAQRQRLQNVFKSVHASLGYFPVILANNVGSFYFTYGRSFLIPGPGNFRPLDAYDLEAFAGTLQATKPGVNACNGPPEDFVVAYRDPEDWLSRIQLIANASQANLSLIAMMASAGCESFPMEGLGAKRTQLQHFAYASYLMAVASPTSKTRFGIPAYYRENGTRYALIDDWFYIKIGVPMETYHPSDTIKYQVHGHSSFVRQFSNGLVIVNPANSTDDNVPLNNIYYRPANAAYCPQEPMETVTMKANTGLILLRK